MADAAVPVAAAPADIEDVPKLPKPAAPRFTGPEVVTLAPGESVWACRCGQSKTWPRCDGSHKAYNEAHGTTIRSEKITNEGTEEKKVYLCTCGESKTRPLCDGTHRKLTPPEA